MRKRIISFAFLILTVGCQNVEQTKFKEVDTNNKGQVFSARNKQKENFLFLNFWTNMTKKEYQIICDSLMQSETLTTYGTSRYTNNYNYVSYDTVFVIITKNNNIYDENNRKYNFKIHPSFEEDKLVKITLSTDFIGSEDCVSILNLYEEKYGKFKVKQPKLEQYIKNEQQMFFSIGAGSRDFKIEYATYYPCVAYFTNTNNSVIQITENYSLYESKDDKGFLIKNHSISSLDICYVSKKCHLEELLKEEKTNQDKNEELKKTKKQI